jgi:hypothetical protein
MMTTTKQIRLPSTPEQEYQSSVAFKNQVETYRRENVNLFKLEILGAPVLSWSFE